MKVSDTGKVNHLYLFLIMAYGNIHFGNKIIYFSFHAYLINHLNFY